MKFWWATVCLVVVGVSGAAVAGKDKAAPPKPEAAAAEAPDPKAASANEASPDADKEPTIPHIVGPKHVELGHNASIDLPEGMILIERKAAQELMRQGGNSAEAVVALIAPRAEGPTWHVVIEAEDVGYVDDDDANDIDASDMLDEFKKGTIEQNKLRKEKGVPELFVDRWSEPPRYERAQHHLVWGLAVHDSDGPAVNFFTRLLGREGYLSVDLIDDPGKIESSKGQALSVLTAVHFAAGSRYEDHASSDKSSGMGLKALMLGGAGLLIAKKTGLLVVILLGLKKGLIVVVAAIGGFFKWLFRRKSSTSSETPPSDGPPPSSPPDQGEPPAAG